MWVYLLDANEGRLGRHHGLCSTVDMQPRRYGVTASGSKCVACSMGVSLP